MWCYKTTKEALDRVDRYETQYEVDKYVLEDLKKSKSFQAGQDAKKWVDDFEAYMNKKQTNVIAKKFADPATQRLSPEYEYLTLRFSALEKAIKYFLGVRGLDQIYQAYEKEMMGRILSERDHH